MDDEAVKPCIQNRIKEYVRARLRNMKEGWKENFPYIIIGFSFFIALYFFLHPALRQAYWDSFFPEWVATGLGVLIATSLTLIQIKDQRNWEHHARTSAVKEALLLEIKLHKEILLRNNINIGKEGNYEKMLPTFSFDGIIASGLYTHVPPELQQIVSRHYQGCHKSNNYVNARLVALSDYKREVQDTQSIIRQEIDNVIEKLKELS